MPKSAPLCRKRYLSENYLERIPGYTDSTLLHGVKSHEENIANNYADYASATEKAALRRWGSYLRREARRRRLI